VSRYDVIVVGGGAAGLMAAGQAAKSGNNVLLLEKMDQPGRKIFITGKFRCNLTNSASIPEFIDHFRSNGQFLRQAFHRFFSVDLMDFFNDLGVPTVIERGGRVFPLSGKSKDIVEAMVRWCKGQGVEIRNYTPVEKIILENREVTGIETPNKTIHSKRIIIATGGASYPGTGSTGDGYHLAANVNHKIIPVRPALVPLVTSGDTAQRLQGLSLRNVTVSVFINGKRTDTEFGEMVFTHFGVSGPIILTLSRQIVDAIIIGKRVAISIDLKPALDNDKLDARILRDLDTYGKKQFKSILKNLLPQKLVPVCIDFTRIPESKFGNQITSPDRQRLLTWLKNFQLDVIGHRGFRHAIITAGGVDIREVNPRTMESKLVKGLYFAGEILDFDADTGGFNMQAAFSTGWLAGKSAAESCF
jgi:predicted Rossmann fold flavoprotein